MVGLPDIDVPFLRKVDLDDAAVICGDDLNVGFSIRCFRFCLAMENSGGNSKLDLGEFLGLMIPVLCNVTLGSSVVDVAVQVAVVVGTFSLEDVGDFFSDTDLYKSPKCSLRSIGFGLAASGLPAFRNETDLYTCPNLSFGSTRF